MRITCTVDTVTDRCVRVELVSKNFTEEQILSRVQEIIGSGKTCRISFENREHGVTFRHKTIRTSDE